MPHILCAGMAVLDEVFHVREFPAPDTKAEATEFFAVGGGNAAWNRRGVRIPSQQRATQVFKQLFIRGTEQEEARELRRLRDGQSIQIGRAHV